MKSLVLYDSFFGCTKQVAEAIFAEIISRTEAKIVRINNPEKFDLKEFSLLIVGSPTRGFRPTKGTTDFLNSIPNNGLAGIKVAAFDTRIALDTIKSSALRFVVKTGGYAADPISSLLKKKGGYEIVPPEGFYVVGEEGPIKEGEVARASLWAKNVLDMLL